MQRPHQNQQGWPEVATNLEIPKNGSAACGALSRVPLVFPCSPEDDHFGANILARPILCTSRRRGPNYLLVYTAYINIRGTKPSFRQTRRKSKNQVAMWPELILIISYSTQNHSKSLIIHVQRSVPDPSLVQAPLIPAAHASLAAWRAEEGSRPEGHRPNQGFPRSRSVHLAIARKAERSIARAWQGLVKSITKRDSSKRHSPSSSSTTITTTTATATTTTTTATY